MNKKTALDILNKYLHVRRGTQTYTLDALDISEALEVAIESITEGLIVEEEKDRVINQIEGYPI